MKNPLLRFRDFEDDWTESKVKDVLQRVVLPVSVNPGVEYREIGIRSHGKGIFHKPLVTGESLGEKRIFWVQPGTLILNIVFAWEQAVAVTTDREKGMVASHRFPMYESENFKAEPEFVLRLFMTKRGKKLLELASPGGAGRNKTLGQKEFEELKLRLPSTPEQRKIAAFLSALDDRISQQDAKVQLLREYKSGAMQRIFDQELRFTNADGSEFPDWEVFTLLEVFSEVKDKVGSRKLETYSVSSGKGLVSQKEKFGKDISGNQNSNYVVLKPADFTYNKGNSKSYKYGCVYPNLTGVEIAVPNVFISFRARKDIDTSFYAKLFEWGYLDRFLKTMITSGARLNGLLNINKKGFFAIEVPYPCPDEQKRIGEFFDQIDAKISGAEKILDSLKTFKQGVMQQMFV